MSKRKSLKNNATKEAEVEKTTVNSEPKISFDSWFAMRASKIPSQHQKEIIKADFKARKVPMVASMADFDMALNKYGIKLN